MNGRGQGLATFATAGGGVGGNVLYNDVFAPAQLLHSAASAAGPSRSPAPPSTARTCSPGGWPTAAASSIKGRLQPEPTKPFEREVELSRPDLGAVPAGQFAVTGDRLAGFAVAMAQGGPAQPRDHRRAARPPAGPPGRDRPQRVAERPAGEARVAAGP